jgi:16S rRNA G966 N2-methylase RsmD
MEMSFIDFEIPPETHPDRYWIHKFWARKPTNVVRTYIEHYTKVGDIILDPFCGSGVIPIEAFFLGRKAVGIDLNPFATFLTRMTAIPCELERLQATFTEIEDEVKDKIRALYETPCPNCNKTAQIISTVWVKSQEPTHVFIECPYCLKEKKKDARQLIKVRLQDIASINEAEKVANKELKRFAYPTSKLPHDADAETVDQLFSKRNLYALCLLLDAISKKAKEKEIRDLLKLTFTANLEPVSKLIPLRNSRLEKGVVPAGSWYEKRFRISKDRVEGNVWYYFYHRFQKTVRGKEDSNKELENFNIQFNEARSFGELLNDENILIATQSATDLKSPPAQIPDGSVDYIFTDPPYAGAVPYFGLSTMWAAWLGYKIEYDGEITVDERRGKSADQYRKDLIAAFKEMHRVLKKDKLCTLWFHYKDPDIWFALLNAAEYVGFEKVALVPQRPAKTSGTMGGNPETAITGDFIVTFKRLDKARSDLYINGYGYVIDLDKLVLEETTRLLVDKLDGMRYDDVYDNLIQIMINRGLYHTIGREKITKEKILSIIKGNFKTKDVQGVTHWLFDDKNEKLKQFVKEEELIRHYLSSILNSFGSTGATISQIHERLIPLLPHLETADPKKREKKLIHLLKEIGAHVTFPDLWTLAPKYEKGKAITKLEHNEVIYMLYEIGKRCGYQVYIGKVEQGKSFKGQRLGDLDILKDLPAELGNTLTANDQRFIEQIDTLWIKDREIQAFEIEFSTGITSGGQRICNLIEATNDWSIKGYVVVVATAKDEREVNEKLGDRLFQKFVKVRKLFYILTPSLTNIYKSIKKSPNLEVNIQGTIENIAKIPSIEPKLPDYR